MMNDQLLLIDLRAHDCPMPSVHLRIWMENLKEVSQKRQRLFALIRNEKSAQNVAGFLTTLRHVEKTRLLQCRPCDPQKDKAKFHEITEMNPDNWLIEFEAF